MKVKKCFVAVVVLIVCGTAFAESKLERTEILNIFKQLINQSSRTWIPAGTLKAKHTEYKAPDITDPNGLNELVRDKISQYQSSTDKPELAEFLQKMKLDAIPFNARYKFANEFTMISSETVKYDGNKFLWEIDVESRNDSVQLPDELKGNYMAEHFNMDWNAKRVFAWDGENYTIYSLPGNGAIVDGSDKLPHAVNGPLTAGLIPWGYGLYSYSTLANAGLSGIEKDTENGLCIYITVNYTEDRQIIFELYPAKNYAVSSCIMNTEDHIIAKQYSDYVSVSGKWVPKTISLRKFRAETGRLLNQNLWNISVLDANVPYVEEFKVDFKNDASIEYFTPLTDKSIKYRYLNTFDNDKLLIDKLLYEASKADIPQNCATASLKYAAEKLGKNISPYQLAEIVKADNTSSLYAMKEFAENQGFYCRAIKTDIETLKKLNNCQVILHIPHRKHFIVLESIESNFIRLIDITSRRLYYRSDVGFFNMDWTQGTALLISNQEIAGDLDDIENAELKDITGASGYSCTRMLQDANLVYCQQVGGSCEGQYEEFYLRYGCETAYEGACSMNWEHRLITSLCIIDPYQPLFCAVTGNWTVYWMLACNSDYVED